MLLLPPPFLFLIFLILQTVTPLLLSPISKDPSTQLYTLSVYVQTPLQPTTLHLHLGSSLTWLLCNNYNHRIPCNSSLCATFNSGGACSNNTCSLFPENPITRKTLLSTANFDTLALRTSDGSTQGPLVQIKDFVFSCSTVQLLQGLAQNATGLAALGRNNLSLPAQISASLSTTRCFALCLPASTQSPGAAIFASTGPYIFNSKIDVSKSLVYTPLIVNPVADTVISYNGQPSDEYFVNVTSIRINGKDVPINASILAIDQDGLGGTKISTSEPYTVMESSVYKWFVELFVNESLAFNLTATEAVEPFGVCYREGDLSETRVGPAVPTVDLVMHSDDVFWRIFGGNSMVRIEKEGVGMGLWCLGFVDGGAHRRTSVVIGGHQLEDNLVQFDLDSNRFGFSSSLLLQATTCSNLNISNFVNNRI
ncbi:probable aspartic proteinase GIP1 [Arachis stenosperma]|uniref:probable aspartic proteinase GIP1 n=1 Tax=Arachis stenosperma TaxID=217475 RepID=UPI0025ABA845|nr:probable aspartic proteinase GIP1 [Arachis stenosperma]